MHERLLEHGKKCDYSLDHPLDLLMQTYNHGSNHHFIDNFDSRRRDFQRKVMNLGPSARICNHFKSLRCTTSGNCDCKENQVYNPSTGLCTTRRSLICAINNEIKIFQVQEYNSMHDQKFFVFKTLDCETGTMCVKLVNEYSRVCLVPGDFEAAKKLQLEFEKKFSLEIGEKCNPSDHVELFDLGSGSTESTTFTDAKNSIQNLVNKVSVKYCKVREHATCSTEGTCTCVPPTVPGGGICVAPPHETCDINHQTTDHLALDKLVLPLQQTATTAMTNLFCYEDATCKHFPTNNYNRKITLCACKMPLKFGDLCDLDKSKLGEHLGDVHYLPNSMNNPDGLKLISEIQHTLFQIEASMTLKYGESCDSITHNKLDNVVPFFLDLRLDCQCHKGVGWYCNSHGSFCNIEKYDKPKFEAILKETKDILSRSKPLCDWNRGVRCVANICSCPKESFLENNHCHIDLGGRCNVYTNSKFNDPYSDRCRSGLHCKIEQVYCTYKGCESRCSEIHPSVLSIYPSKTVVPDPAYISAVKQTLIKHIESSMGRLKRSGVLSPGSPCQHIKEEALKKALEAIPILDFSKNSMGISDERQAVRELEGLANKVDRLTNDYSKIEICNAESMCDPATNKCVEDPTQIKKTTSSPSPSHSSSLSFNSVYLMLLTSAAIFLVVLCI